MRSPGRLEVLWLTFLTFSVLLAYLVPNRLYFDSEAFRTFADSTTSVVGSIDQFAAVSEFPGTTRIVLATLSLCVLPLALVQWLVPGFITWTPAYARLKSRVLLWGMVILLLAITLLLPVVLEIRTVELSERTAANVVFRAMSHWRFALGFFAGAYAVCSAWLLALVPRLVRAGFSSDWTQKRSGR